MLQDWGKAWKGVRAEEAEDEGVGVWLFPVLPVAAVETSGNRVDLYAIFLTIQFGLLMENSFSQP